MNATSARLGGGITVLRNLLPAPARSAPENRYTGVASPEIAQSFSGSDAGLDWIPLRGERLGLGGRIAWEQAVLPALLASRGADVLFCPANLGVLLSPVPQVLMIQNVAPFDPLVVARAPRRQQARFQALRLAGIASARRARRVVFISEFAKRDVGHQLGLPASRYERIYLGRDPRFAPMEAEQAHAALQGLGLESPYLLSVSQFYHYKNFVELVQGFALALAHLPKDCQLVIAGAEHEQDYAGQVRAEIARLGVGDRVRLLGQVPYEQLPALYAGAELFIFPSTCENFPNILVEGMSSGTPTLAGNVGPMPEIAGQGAAYFDPFAPQSIADAIVGLWRDPAKRSRLSRRGPEQAAQYSWERCAAELLRVMQGA